jgi:hypothetical protein
MHRRPAEANLPAQYGPARSTGDAEGHELDEFTVEGLELDGWVVSEDCIFAISERRLTVDEQAAFVGAKQKELQPFFDNAAWKCKKEADPSRTMMAQFLLGETAPTDTPKQRPDPSYKGSRTQMNWKKGLRRAHPRHRGWPDRRRCPSLPPRIGHS